MRPLRVIRSLIVSPSGILTETESCVLPWQFVLVYIDSDSREHSIAWRNRQLKKIARIYLETDSFHPFQLDGFKILLNITLTQEGYQD
jgi:hypothetical protein